MGSLARALAGHDAEEVIQGTWLRAMESDAVPVQLPATTPASGKIAFTSTRDGNSEIYVIDDNGFNEFNLTNYPADDVEPTWSPNGSKIAFAALLV